MDVRTIAFYNRPFPLGGAETVSRNLAHFFHKQGLRVIIYTSLLQKELLTEEDLRAFETRVLPNPDYESHPDNIAFLRRSLEIEMIDILIIQCFIYFPFEELYHQGRTRLIFCLHSIPLWEVTDQRSLRSRQLSNPTLHRRLEFIFLRKPVYLLTDKLKRRYLRIYAKIHQHTDRFMTLCSEYGDSLYEDLRRYEHAPIREKLASIPNPLLPPQAPTHCPKEKIVLFVGRFSYCDKRVDRLLRIWHRIEKKVADWRLILVGDGPERENLLKLAARLKLQRVEFAGYQSDVIPYYRRASFVCLTSSFEGLPMSLLEGQQYGVIPVSFDSYNSIQDITCHGQAGIIVPAFSKRQYARRLTEAMLDTERQKQMREECYLQAATYDLQRIGEQWLRLFKTID